MAKEEKKEERKTFVLLPGAEKMYFSDAVRVRSGESGFYLSFCVLDPDETSKINCSFQVFLPPKVAGSLTNVLLNHISGYQHKFNTTIVPESMKFDLEPEEEESQK